MKMTRTLALAAALVALGMQTTSADRVVVLGSKMHLHPVADAPASFSVNGLAELAIGALGGRTGKVETERAGEIAPDAKPAANPVLADVFHRVDAYMQVFVDGQDAALLDAVNPPKQADFHKTFDLEKGAVDAVPESIAQELDATTTTIKCVGAGKVCESDVLPHDEVDVAQVKQVLAKHTFLEEADAADMTLAQELAQTQQLIDSLAHAKKHAFLVASYSSVEKLAADKQKPAREVITANIEALVTAVQKAYPANGVQLVAATPVQVEEATSTSRMLLAGSGTGSFSGSVVPNANVTTGNATSLAANASNTTSTDNFTPADIEEYQIILWTSVLLVAALAMIIMAMCNMDSHKDSLLYAKFTTSQTRKYD